MKLFNRYFAGLLIFLFALPILAVAQKEDSEPANSSDMELKACGPSDKEAKYVADTDKKQHPTGTAQPDTALIYVIRSTMFGNKIQTKLAVDGEWKGVNRGDNYFFFTVKPGEHYFCGRAENRAVLVLNVEAGKTYYLGQRIHMGMWKARTDLVAMNEADGQQELAKAHPSTWTVK